VAGMQRLEHVADQSLAPGRLLKTNALRAKADYRNMKF
jgi:hypothetical protein